MRRPRNEQPDAGNAASAGAPGAASVNQSGRGLTINRAQRKRLQYTPECAPVAASLYAQGRRPYPSCAVRKGTLPLAPGKGGGAHSSTTIIGQAIQRLRRKDSRSSAATAIGIGNLDLRPFLRVLPSPHPSLCDCDWFLSAVQRAAIRARGLGHGNFGSIKCRGRRIGIDHFERAVGAGNICRNRHPVARRQ